MAIAVASRDIEGIEAPAAGTWDIDPSHSSVGFVARHLMVSKVRGRFGAFEGTLHIAEDPGLSQAEVTIDVSSIDTQDPKRDEHLRSPDFFDAASYPTMHFRSTGFRRLGGRDFELPGELTIRDVTRPVTLGATYEGLALDPWGTTKAVFTASTEIDREAFGLTWNVALESGGVLVGKKVKIELEIQARQG
jgi:polyisoprenoid-binding protein YceI